MTHHLVIGAGEVGRGLTDVTGWDIADVHTEHDFDDEYDVIHIAFPYMETGFIDEVDRYARIHDADIVVVHSTVPVGTCDSMGWLHAPIRGRHPNLAEGIQTFTMPVGGMSSADVDTIRDALREHGVSSDPFPNARTTELGKLLELAQYGVEIRMQKEAYWLAREYGVDPEHSYRAFGMRYNLGWQKLADRRFVKPVLDEIPGPVGGHCVSENTPMLRSEFFTEALRPISRDTWDERLT